ncbi:MAG: hypothetical protein IBX55_13975 [Methyloprofundus sp.]|nr:hypothetical protein [Methyloprofundus sp.]
MSTTDTDRGLKKILAEMQALGSKSVKVGIQDDAGSHSGGDMSVAAIAYINEYGTRDGRIPPRPAHTNAFDDNRRKLDALVLRLNRAVADGKMSADQAAKLLGQTHEDNVKQSIRSLSSPANATSTVTRKGSSNPLIDTGQTVNSVRYVVEG